jgi:hypothetical protein
MKSTILSTTTNSNPSKYQRGKCYLWNINGNKLIILCTIDHESLIGVIINVIRKNENEENYIVGYFSMGWGSTPELWTGKIELETE